MKRFYSTLIISAAIAFSNSSVADEKHYMPHSGDGPQGHMMEGKVHPKGGSTEHVETYGHDSHKEQKATHYMMHGGDGHQGHMMKGKSHPAGASSDHVEKYGNGEHSKTKGKHYMMEGGDGPQGQMMKGDKHPSS